MLIKIPLNSPPLVKEIFCTVKKKKPRHKRKKQRKISSYISFSLLFWTAVHAMMEGGDCEYFQTRDKTGAASFDIFEIVLATRKQTRDTSGAASFDIFEIVLATWNKTHPSTVFHSVFFCPSGCHTVMECDGCTQLCSSSSQ